MLYTIALLTKIHLLVIAPFLVIFLYKKHEHKQLIQCTLLVSSLILLVILPFLSEGLIFYLLKTPESDLLYNTFYSIGSLKLYLAPLLLSFFYLKFFCHNRTNHDLLLGYITLSFTTLILLTHPMPSWYLWAVPYIYIFTLDYWKNNRRKILLILIIVNIFYIIYFLVFYQNPVRDFADLIFMDKEIIIGKRGNDSKLHYLFFTLLESSVLCLTYFIYNFSVKSNALYNNQNVLMAIAGDSSSGKTMLKQNILNMLGKRNIIAIEGDGEHRWKRGDKNWDQVTHLDPRANKLHFQFDYLINLKMNKPVTRQDYNHHTGDFDQEKLIVPKRFIILSGLHSFYLPKARKLADIKIFLDTDYELLKYWKINRDTTERGYDINKIKKSIQKREPDRNKYILPQKQFSDIYFRVFTKEKPVPELKNIDLKLQLEIGLNADFNIDYLLQELLNINTLTISHDFSDDIKNQKIIISGNITNREIYNIAHKIIPNLNDLVISDVRWENDIQGLQQLFILFTLSNHLSNSQGLA